MIAVLRLGHRPVRDKRITTHVGLVARAFGADRIIITTQDSKIESTLNSVVKRFGGDFKVETGVHWREFIRNWKKSGGKIVHLTMFGEDINRILNAIPRPEDADILIIVGATKVPRELFALADFNVAIGDQPHSEVGALAVFLDRYLAGEGLKRKFNK